ncbi:PPOX class F420-dependent oxidoreductase [uncultured Microbacterium sp.]|uniref:PPOX class F420-dependent oxidoreductase n=1 Tax=uncultured Microbacterium sp. TaxID=191216 RepID=UPI0025FC0E84|nr:PPOX class F420-dependent oxidoreductase [uncultured Microbacterium sp.]
MTSTPSSTSSSDDWRTIGAADFVLFGTYRRNGDLVEVPVWIAPLGDALVVTSERNTGKVKRLRRDDRVRLRPCGRRGAPVEGGPVVEARAQGVGATKDHPEASTALHEKYGWQYTAILGFERFVRRLQRKPGDRVILRVERAS